jgi:rhamnulokinase
MPAAIAAYCRATGQSEPTGQPGYARAILESLALKYRIVLDSLEQLTGRRYTRIRIVGGGSRNRLLNQLTADATRRTVLAGPVEATALGNIAMQLLATGTVNTLDEARAIIEQSFPVERFDPVSTDRWTPHYQRVQEYMEVMGV